MGTSITNKIRQTTMSSSNSSTSPKPLVSWKAYFTSSGSDTFKTSSGSDRTYNGVKSDDSGSSYLVASPFKMGSSSPPYLAGSSSTNKLSSWRAGSGSPPHFSTPKKDWATLLAGSTPTDKLASWRAGTGSPLFSTSPKDWSSHLVGSSSTDKTALWGLNTELAHTSSPSQKTGSSKKKDSWLSSPLVGTSSENKSFLQFPFGETIITIKPLSTAPLAGLPDLARFHIKSTYVLEPSPEETVSNLKTSGLSSWNTGTTSVPESVPSNRASVAVASLKQVKLATTKAGSLGQKKMPENNEHSRREKPQNVKPAQQRAEEWKTKPGMRRVVWEPEKS